MSEVVLEIPVVDFARRRQPHIVMAADIRQGLVEVFGAKRLADQEGVQTDREDTPVGRALAIEHIELILDHRAEVGAAQPHR